MVNGFDVHESALQEPAEIRTAAAAADRSRDGRGHCLTAATCSNVVPVHVSELLMAHVPA